MMSVFDRKQIARQKMRAAKAPASHSFLFDWTFDQIIERLDVVKRQFSSTLQIGARGKSIPFAMTEEKDFFICDSCIRSIGTKIRSVVCEPDFMPFAPESFDLIISALDLHTVNDLPGALLQIRRCLKPDGLFLAAFLGGETLFELRDSLQIAELEISGGISPRVAPFADKPQIGGLLQRAGFSLPVIDSEIVTVTYDSIYPLMHDLRLMGEGNAIIDRKKTFSRRDIFLRAAEIYAQKYSETDGKIRASFEIIFALGWAPHESQQKPLRPGTAQSRLSDFLGTVELSTDEKP